MTKNKTPPVATGPPRRVMPCCAGGTVGLRRKGDVDRGVVYREAHAQGLLLHGEVFTVDVERFVSHESTDEHRTDVVEPIHAHGDRAFTPDGPLERREHAESDAIEIVPPPGVAKVAPERQLGDRVDAVEDVSAVNLPKLHLGDQWVREAHEDDTGHRAAGRRSHRHAVALGVDLARGFECEPFGLGDLHPGGERLLDLGPDSITAVLDEKLLKVVHRVLPKNKGGFAHLQARSKDHEYRWAQHDPAKESAGTSQTPHPSTSRLRVRGSAEN